MEIRNSFADKEDFLDEKVIYVTDYEEKRGKYGDEILLTVPLGDDEIVVSLWPSHLKKYAKLLGRKQVNKDDFINKYFKLKSVQISQSPDGKKVYGWLPLEYLKDFAPTESVV